MQMFPRLRKHGEIKPLGGWQAVAFAMRTLGSLGHSASTQG